MQHAETYPYEVTKYPDPGDWKVGKQPCGVQTVQAYRVGALCVHRALGEHPRRPWRISHGASSVVIASAPNKRDALATARAIDAAIDWDISESQAFAIGHRMADDPTFVQHMKDLHLPCLRGKATLSRGAL